MVLVEIGVNDTEVIEDMKHNCALISLSLGGNEVDEQVIEKIEHELAANRGIDSMILPMIKNKEKSQDFKNHKLSLSGKGISNLDFLAKFIRENPQITGVNIEVDDFNKNEMAKVAKELEGNKSKLSSLYLL